MSSKTRESRYISIGETEEIDLDLENDSDTTLASTGFLEKQNTSRRPLARYEARSRLQSVLTWFRWGVIVFLQGVIVMLLLPSSGILDSGWNEAKTETGGDVNGLYIPTKHKYTLLTFEEDKFVPNMTSDDNRMEVRKNWDMLMPLGSGSVEIPDYKNYPMLGEPITDDPIRNGSIFEASWTHALHCLYYTVDTYHQLVVNNKFGFDDERNDYHASHCFEYLRNQILCMADMTLEGSPSLLGATGQGQAHMCRDREEAISWIEGRRLDDIQSIVGP
ncbi:Uncharacterized protein BP5553_00090 [Venustampulla echinocandica]|uniref:Oxidase ustYa n=1 Tax=Venustampulla echinocandica TaxID=2656787 RepID=A0A370TX58_9HELO|nr:Uncharacterized protein BP5553_00090 [Venustampulla echinocandica]RDL40111.1 Uncharacterized protein BP5553_00090 [Venustampulla echinocandica]